MRALFVVAGIVAAIVCFTLVAFAQPEVTETEAVEVVGEETSFLDDLEILKAELKPLVLYSITENQVTYATGVQILGYKGAELDLAYSSDKDLIGLALGYEVNYLEKFGVNIPLARYLTLSVGGYVGSRDFTSETRSSDWGLWATPVKIEW